MSGSCNNGYTPAERDAKRKVLLDRISKGELAEASGPCMLCGDPEAPVAYHDEDYSKAYLWELPALLSLCTGCHKDKVHKRFGRTPAHWHAFIAHVRRGGYARDLKDLAINKELVACRQVFETGRRYQMRRLRQYASLIGTEWFADLRLASASKIDPAARPCR